MQALNVVLLQSDPRTVQVLADSLGGTFHSVYAARSLDELRTSIARNRAVVAILDMELVSISDVERLSHEFPGICIVCNHRLADEQMWTAALNAGAADICTSNDTRAILTTAVRNATMARSAAA